MPWSKDLEVGIAKIDEQHHWLVDLTNELYNRMSESPDSAQIGEVLEKLVDYTINHFIAEEDLFLRFGYPETEFHVNQHNRFTKRVFELLSRHENGEAVSQEALDLLKHWLTEHIMKCDKAYVSHLSQFDLDSCDGDSCRPRKQA